ncbi:LLM class flavin-dependent oxidoreductase [Frigoribacterium sp. CFBP9039]|uniref:LLM class flavin-dependent oxidoreductase n=1 Tax=Frigoribacterium TaxID=96492 RepID=UPI00177E69A1|nr:MULTISPECIES: LLM class flavin-dependent oxidoreductase [Frigoribacterium]MBD8702739.1 LLM class flavin-dependent oxidoreductase [Frigoribacterium sp. CFBP 13712]MCJ0700159.1 LLM class flavin-dependent oxidoreductase [Frigoribacterium faeni]MDY0892811.1 LLM class flavin-dependent oxidoreductase [Frigoribacterium sp. CFBP9030]MDY0946023.1 LLM class flavin-dependent oxidoreductase [Frigoribacterium sp. CFBP9039]
MSIPLSILDLAPVAPGETVRDSFAASVALAQQAEASGYRRVWYAEHHNMASIASSATSVLIAHIASQTKTIRLGSGGVMLPNHSPLTIAEQFGTLETLHPGRIDLGLGRAPGSDQATFRALRRDPASSERFPQDILELQAFLAGESRIAGVQAVPGGGTNVPLYILGSSLFGAKLAAALGLPYAFASHFAPNDLIDAVTAYRREFQPSEQLAEPYVIAAVNAVVADDSDDADAQFAVVKRQRLLMLLRQSGQIDVAREFDDAELDHLLRTPVGQHVLSMTTYTAVGTPSEAREYMEQFARTAQADELIVAHAGSSKEARLRSVALLADAMRLTPAA